MGSVAFLSHMDEKLAALTREEDLFATAFLGIINLKKNVIRYATAGHSPPALIRTGRALPLHGTGAALGLLGNSIYEVHEEKLQAGDILLSYTDGAIEACSPEGEELGAEPLIDVFIRHIDRPLEEAVRNLHDEIVRFSGQIQLADDLTLIAVRMRQAGWFHIFLSSLYG